MIASVTFEYAGRPAEAVLGDDGRWSCPDAAVESLLNTFLVAADRGPSAGRKFWRHAHEMAAVLHGVAEFDPGTPADVPGRVY